MNGNKEISSFLVGDGGASFERNKGVILARVYHFCAQPRLQYLAQAPADFEHQVLFFQAVRPNGSGIVASVARIDHDSTNLQSQRANERPLAASCGLCLSHVEFRRQITSVVSRRPTGRDMNRAVSAGSRYARHDQALWCR